MQTQNDTSKVSDTPQEKTDERLDARSCSACCEYQTAMYEARKKARLLDERNLDLQTERHELMSEIAKALGIQTGKERWWSATNDEKQHLILSRIKKIKQNAGILP